jgi:hypothetical protein
VTKFLLERMKPLFELLVLFSERKNLQKRPDGQDDQHQRKEQNEQGNHAGGIGGRILLRARERKPAA